MEYPEEHSVAVVANPHRFSYPGYNEIQSGRHDPRIDPNTKQPNPNVTVLEWFHSHNGYAGHVHASASWDVFPFVINAQRSGIPVNAGWGPLGESIDNLALHRLNELSTELPRCWANVPYDYFTFRGDLNVLQKKRPRVLYIAWGETDDWAHTRRYDLYLDATRRTDAPTLKVSGLQHRIFLATVDRHQ